MTPKNLRSAQGIVVVAAVAVLTAAAAFLVTRETSSTGPVFAEDPTEGRTAEDYTALLQEHSNLPRYTRTVAGILLGPDVERSGEICGPDSPPELVSSDAAFGTELDARPAYLPAGAELASDPAVTVIRCGADIASVEAWYHVPPNSLTETRGGSIQIFRFRGDNAFALDEPSDLLAPVSVSGKNAVLSPPVLDDGFGPSALVVDERFGLTVIRANGHTSDELIRIAESLGGA